MSADCKSAECHALFFVVIAVEILQEPVPKICRFMRNRIHWMQMDSRKNHSFSRLYQLNTVGMFLQSDEVADNYF